MMTIEELISILPAKVDKLKKSPADSWEEVQFSDFGETGLEVPCFYCVDNLCIGDYDIKWDDIMDNFDLVQSAAQKLGANIMQSDGNYTYYYIYITKPMTAEESEDYLKRRDNHYRRNFV